MTRFRLRLIAFATVALAAVVGYETRIIHRQREELRTLIENEAALERNRAALCLQRESSSNELQSAEAQLAQLSAAAEAANAAYPHRANDEAWLARVRALRQLFHDQPGQRIPEMELLTDMEWLREARSVNLTEERHVRAALANLRNAAKAKFIPRLTAAMHRYASANQAPPPSPSALAAYFEPAIDPLILARYEIIIQPQQGRSGMSSAARANPPSELEKLGFKRANADAPWAMQERAPIDFYFDSRPIVYSTGGYGQSPAPAAWIPNFYERLKQGRARYFEQNPGAPPPAIETTLPYVDPPFEAAVAERLIDIERTRQR